MKTEVGIAVGYVNHLGGSWLVGPDSPEVLQARRAAVRVNPVGGLCVGVSLFVTFSPLTGAQFVVVGVMELDKMDENDWRYHGEGNKSLVVSHVQVSRLG